MAIAIDGSIKWLHFVKYCWCCCCCCCCCWWWWCLSAWPSTPIYPFVYLVLYMCIIVYFDEHNVCIGFRSEFICVIIFTTIILRRCCYTTGGISNQNKNDDDNWMLMFLLPLNYLVARSGINIKSETKCIILITVNPSDGKIIFLSENLGLMFMIRTDSITTCWR